MLRIDGHTTWNLFDYLYHWNYYKCIGIDLSGKTNTSIPQQINFVEKLEEDNSTAIFFITEKQQKDILNFSSDSLNVRKKYKQWNIKKTEFIQLNTLLHGNSAVHQTTRNKLMIDWTKRNKLNRSKINANSKFGFQMGGN